MLTLIFKCWFVILQQNLLFCKLGPTGYYSCPKCVIEGDSDKNIHFLGSNMVKRTDHSFRQKTQPEHHIGISLIERIPKFNLIENVTLDYMHIVCLRVVKRILTHKKFGLVFGKTPIYYTIPLST